MSVIQAGKLLDRVPDFFADPTDRDQVGIYVDAKGKESKVLLDGDAVQRQGWFSTTFAPKPTLADGRTFSRVSHLDSARSNFKEAFASDIVRLLPDRTVVNAWNVAKDWAGGTFCKVDQLFGENFFSKIMAGLATGVVALAGLVSGAVVGALFDAAEIALFPAVFIKDLIEGTYQTTQITCDKPACKENKCSASIENPTSNRVAAFTPTPPAPRASV